MESLTAVGTPVIDDPDDDIGQAPTHRITRNENLVYAALKDAGRPMKAYELLDVLHDQGVRAPMTIYRALDGLQAKHLALKVVSKNAFICVDQSANQNFQAVITCRQCGETELVPLEESDVKAVFGVNSMPISNVVIEAVGECAAHSSPKPVKSALEN